MIFNLFKTKLSIKFDIADLRRLDLFTRHKYDNTTFSNISSELNLYQLFFCKEDTSFKDDDLKIHEYNHTWWQINLLNLGADSPYLFSLVGTSGEFDNYKESEEWYLNFDITFLFLFQIKFEWWEEPQQSLKLDDVLPSYEEEL